MKRVLLSVPLAKKEMVPLHANGKGLSTAQARERLKRYGLNQIERQSFSLGRLLAKQFASPFVYLLVASTGLSFFFQDNVEGWMIVGFVVLNGLLGFLQEYHAERAVAMLQAILRPSCTVYRDGKEQRVPCQELVPGDVCFVELGDIVPADGTILEAGACLCDESVLTGESFPITKQVTQPLFAGVKITQGWAKMLVTATGRLTSLGKIAKLATDTAVESSYQRSVRQLSVAILLFVVVAVVITFVLRLVFPGQSHLNLVQFAIFSVALAVSVVPETLPLVVTICLSRGAVLMAKRKVVVKRLSSIEDLGSIQILCTDKTGTLTENVLRVAGMHTYTLDPRVTALFCVEPARLKDFSALDPFNRALLTSLSPEERKQLHGYELKAHLPFDPRRKRVTVLMKNKEGLHVISCGAPEEVLTCCNELPSDFTRWVSQEGKEGRRVLAIAVRTLSVKNTIASLEREEKELTLCGGISFEDPLKPTAYAALQRIRTLGVEVKMLTGDSPEVALAIAKRVGLVAGKEGVVTGSAFLKLTSVQRRRALKTCHVFARVDPEEKYDIIKELQRHGSVGFLGEGINDAPALKLANVGIAVKEASDIAREAADIILLDKGLEVVAEGIIQGRRVFVNIGKYLRTTLVSNFGNFFSIVTALFFIPSLPMLPVQILLLNLLSDLPMTAICLDSIEEEETVRPVQFPIRSLLTFCLLLGTVSTAFDFIFFTVYRHLSFSRLQVMWFLASVLTELVLIFSLRSSRWFFQSTRPPKSLWITTAVALGIVFLVIETKPLMMWFSFPRPTTSLLLITIGLVGLYFLTTDVVKRIYYSHTRARV